MICIIFFALKPAWKDQRFVSGFRLMLDRTSNITIRFPLCSDSSHIPHTFHNFLPMTQSPAFLCFHIPRDKYCWTFLLLVASSTISSHPVQVWQKCHTAREPPRQLISDRLSIILNFKSLRLMESFERWNQWPTQPISPAFFQLFWLSQFLIAVIISMARGTIGLAHGMWGHGGGQPRL